MTDISSPPRKNPIASKDRAETFTESDVSVNTSGGYLNNGAFVMTPEPDTVSWSLSVDGGNKSEVVGTIDTTPYDTLSGTYTYQKEDLGTGYLNINFNGDRLEDNQTDNTIEYDISDLSGTYELSIDLGDEYSNGDPASTTGDLSTNGPATSSTIYVTWPQPTDIYRWDAATFQTSPDGETVEVYVEESTDGGSTWTEIQGPIERGDQIGADPGSRVRFRVELSRNDTANNPTLDAIYRRWVV